MVVFRVRQHFCSTLPNPPPHVQCRPSYHQPTYLLCSSARPKRHHSAKFLKRDKPQYNATLGTRSHLTLRPIAILDTPFLRPSAQLIFSTVSLITIADVFKGVISLRWIRWNSVVLDIYVTEYISLWEVHQDLLQQKIKFEFHGYSKHTLSNLITIYIYESNFTSFVIEFLFYIFLCISKYAAIIGEGAESRKRRTMYPMISAFCVSPTPMPLWICKWHRRRDATYCRHFVDDPVRSITARLDGLRRDG